MRGRIPEIDAKRYFKRKNTEFRRSWRRAKRSGRPRCRKEAYRKAFQTQVTPWPCVGAFLRSMRKGMLNAKIPNFVVHGDEQSVRVDPEVEMEPIGRASIRKTNRMHTCRHSDDIPPKATIPPKTISPATPSILLQIGRVGARNEAFFE
jgi:hypothetical protein